MDLNRIVIWQIGFSLLAITCLLGCTRDVTECGGTPLDTGKLLSIKETAFSSGPRAFLVVPNPIDATGNRGIQAMDSALNGALDPFMLPELLSPSRLENNFLKVRIRSIQDDPSTLATPNARGEYAYALNDPHYGETMAYHSISAMVNYVQGLGFTTVKTRPLFVMVRAQVEGQDSNAVNAVYSHNYFNPNAPRTMELYGDTQYAPSQDRDIFWHEFGHYFNESVSGERGMDYAGDSGAVFTEAAALHECLADYLAESVSGKGYIGRWIARNFTDIPAGDPLRSAETKSDDFNQFQNVALFDPTGKNLDRYRMAEWCSRVLWDMRSQFVKEDSQTGAIYSDRLVFSAVSLLKRDATVSEFRKALSSADEQLHCGIHSRSIQKAFESRGWAEEVPNLSNPLSLKVNPVALSDSNGAATNNFGFEATIVNPNAETARNVRLILESPDSTFSPDVYHQAYGDLAGGKTIGIGRNGPLPIDYTVQGTYKAGSANRKIRYRLKVMIENGPPTVVDGSF